jgi:Tfp pilus assembly protein PilX
MARFTDEHVGSEQEGAAHRAARRAENRLRAAETELETDAQGLVEFACECTRADCERTVRVPLYVYRRLLEANHQYLLQAGHHAFEHYRTIVSLGLVRIEEKA